MDMFGFDVDELARIAELIEPQRFKAVDSDHGVVWIAIR